MFEMNSLLFYISIFHANILPICDFSFSIREAVDKSMNLVSVYICNPPINSSFTWVHVNKYFIKLYAENRLDFECGNYLII